MKRLFIAGLALLALAGCAPTTWTPYRANTAPVQEALARCEYQAATSPARMVNGGIYGTNALRNMCMSAEGYRENY